MFYTIYFNFLFISSVFLTSFNIKTIPSNASLNRTGAMNKDVKNPWTLPKYNHPNDPSINITVNVTYAIFNRISSDKKSKFKKSRQNLTTPSSFYLLFYLRIIQKLK